MSRSQAFVVISSVLLAVPAASTAAAQTCAERVSVDSAGAEANDASLFHSISSDGRHVAFESTATDLVIGDTNGKADVFVHDRATGLTERVSLGAGGVEGDDASLAPSISADGRYVAFESFASNLVPGDTNGHWDIFVRDRTTGTTTRVSVDSTGVEANGTSTLASISADPSGATDGRFVAFWSYASNLVSGDTNGTADVFVHDRATGQTTRVSVSSAGGQQGGPGFTYRPSIAGDGRNVAFSSEATNLVPGDTNGNGDIFVHDRATGQTMRVSVSSSGAQANGNSIRAAISADGEHVAFESTAADLVAGDTNSAWDVFVHDRPTGQTARVSVHSNGSQGDAGSAFASISLAGDAVAFWSLATNLVPGDSNGFGDIFLHHRTAGQTTRVNLGAGGQANDWSWLPSLSLDGACVAYWSEATNLVLGDGNGKADVFTTVGSCAGHPIYCFGDATGAPCPCGNAGALGEGCANSSGSGGLLAGYGSASVAADVLTFGATQLLPGQPALLFAGVNAINGGTGVPFGDGLRCAGGSVVRLGTKVPDSAGSASWGPGLGANGGWAPGDVRRFQAWYRDPSGPCGSGFNLTNGVEVSFGA